MTLSFDPFHSQGGGGYLKVIIGCDENGELVFVFGPGSLMQYRYNRNSMIVAHQSHNYRYIYTSIIIIIHFICIALYIKTISKCHQSI